jgi:hypothetical protein
MTTAFPTATFLNVPHISLFILASIPVENSSISTTEGLPARRRVSQSAINVNERPGLTDKRNRERQFTLVATRQLTRQPVRIHVQRGRVHERLDVGVQLGSTRESLETPVDQQVFSDSQLGVDGGELWTDPERETCTAGRVDDRDTLDLDIPCVGDDIASFGFTSFQRRGQRGQTKHVRIMLNVVVFPAPLGPSIANMTSPGTPKETSSTTLFPSNDLVT